MFPSASYKDMGSKSDSDGEVGAVGNRLLTASNNLGVEIESLIASEST